MNESDRPAPGANEVLVWLLETEDGDPYFDYFRSVLSPAELTRASGFFRASVGRRFVINRGFLRLLLGRALEVPPANLDITEETNGKPVLGQKPASIAFNLSHTDRLAAFALSAGRRVGIDIESIGKPVDLDAVAAYVFPAAVADRLAALTDEARRDLFFRLWTRLEAAAKACGRGLGGLPELKAAELDGEPPLTLDFNGSRWRVIDLEPAAALPGAHDHRAALCLEGEDCRARVFTVGESVLRTWIAASFDNSLRKG